MGLLKKITDTIGLTTDTSRIGRNVRFEPFNVHSTAGSLFYDKDNRSINAMLSPDLLAQRFNLSQELSGIDPASQLALLRDQAAPYQEAQALDLENRLFSQGLLEHSEVDAPGGARRSLFDSFANADLQRQLQAADFADIRRQNIMNQIMGIHGMEQSLFQNALGAGGMDLQARQARAGIQMQGAQQLPQLMGNLLGGATMGYMMRP